jgi:hypothetical protein
MITPAPIEQKPHTRAVVVPRIRKSFSFKAGEMIEFDDDWG